MDCYGRGSEIILEPVPQEGEGRVLSRQMSGVHLRKGYGRVFPGSSKLGRASLLKERESTSFEGQSWS